MGKNKPSQKNLQISIKDRHQSLLNFSPLERERMIMLLVLNRICKNAIFRICKARIHFIIYTVQHRAHLCYLYYTKWDSWTMTLAHTAHYKWLLACHVSLPTYLNVVDKNDNDLSPSVYLLRDLFSVESIMKYENKTKHTTQLENHIHVHTILSLHLGQPPVQLSYCWIDSSWALGFCAFYLQSRSDSHSPYCIYLIDAIQTWLIDEIVLHNTPSYSFCTYNSGCNITITFFYGRLLCA